MRNRFVWLALLALCAFALAPAVYAQDDGIIEVVLRPVWSDATAADSQVEVLVHALEMRVTDFGLEAAQVTASGPDSIRIRAEAASDEVVHLLEAITAPLTLGSDSSLPIPLEFVDFSSVSSGQIPEGTCILTTEQVDRAAAALAPGAPAPTLDSYTCPPQAPGEPDEPALLQNGQPFRTIMTGAGLASANAIPGAFGADWQIEFSLRQDSAEVAPFFDYVAHNANRPMGIVVNGRLVSYPTIQPGLADSAAAGTMDGGIITGQFTRDEARTLAAQLSSQTGVEVQLVIVRLQYNSEPEKIG